MVPSGVVQVKVDRRGLDAGFVEWFDDDAAGGDLVADGAVGENHDRRIVVWRLGPRRQRRYTHLVAAAEAALRV